MKDTFPPEYWEWMADVWEEAFARGVEKPPPFLAAVEVVDNLRCHARGEPLPPDRRTGWRHLRPRFPPKGYTWEGQ